MAISNWEIIHFSHFNEYIRPFGPTFKTLIKQGFFYILLKKCPYTME